VAKSGVCSGRPSRRPHAASSPRRPAMSSSDAPSIAARPAGWCFSPLDDRLGLTSEGFSPGAIRLAVRQAGKAPFASASEDLRELGNLRISPAHLQRLCERVGTEWAAARDADVEAFRAGQLQPTVAAAPAVAAVMLDGGRLQTRAAQAGPGVHGKAWHETKVACCLSLASQEKVVDPQPEPPSAFLEPPRVARLTQEIKSRKGGATAATRPAETGPKAKGKSRKGRRRRRRSAGKTQKRVRTVLASMANSATFGWHVSAEVHRRRLGEAKRKACVCDGLNWNWSIFTLHLLPLGFIGILDVVHLVAALYAAAQAAESGAYRAWALYAQWLRWAWSGEVRLLLAGLRAVAARLGPAPAEAKEDDPRKVAAGTVTYVENNRERMKYPEYRKQGLPISSAPVESVIKQLNQRVKGSEKFWLGGGAEAVLQVRAAYLSEDGRAERYWTRPRPRGRAVGGGRLGRRC
jgi:hypothetical protein